MELLPGQDSQLVVENRCETLNGKDYTRDGKNNIGKAVTLYLLYNQSLLPYY